MRSELFSRLDYTPGDKEWPRRIDRLLRFAGVSAALLPDLLTAALRATTKAERDKVLDEFAEKSGLPRVEVETVQAVGLGLAGTLADRKLAREDSPEDIASDFLEAGYIEEDRLPELSSALATLKSFALSEYELSVARRRALSSTLPVLSGLGWEVDVRALWHQRYDAADAVEDYSPEILGVVPIVILRVETTQDDQEPLTLQIDAVGIQWLRDQLDSMQAELSAVAEFLNLERK